MKKIPHIFFFLIFFSDSSFSQTFLGSGGLIPDNGNSIDFIINVSGLTSPLDTTNFGLEQICINATHTWDSDLDISLIAPDGTAVLLTSGNGGSGDDYANTCFRNDALTPVTQGNAPFTGTFRPQGDLSAINNGQNGNGQWKLHILDTWAFADQGNLLGWNISFGTNPAAPFLNFSCSNLPIIVINTNSQTIPDEPKILCDMGIIYNGVSVMNCLTDPFNHYNGKIGIELRGSSSQWFPKKSYGFSTIDSLWNKIDSSLLGMPKEHDWILNASYTDKTFLRNVLSYKLYRDFGRYATRTQFCELILNGQYQGVYVLTEKIKRDSIRVDIANLNTWENSGDDLTGGYIIKIDKSTGNGGDGWTSPFLPPVNPSGQTIFFQYEYPKPDSITAQQKNYIQQYVDSFETTLAGPNFNNPANGYVKYCDKNSFIDYFILNEISKNIDGYRLSTFLYKDKFSKGGKLVIGPPWDYDIAWLNADYCGSPSYTDWAYEFGNVCPGDNWQLPFWWDRLLLDTNFTNALQCRWQQLRSTVLDTNYIFSYIDSTVIYIDTAIKRNFILWPILGVYVWPNPSPIPATYPEEISRLKKWIKNRMQWLDANMPGNCWGTFVSENTLYKDISVFPNPTNGTFQIQLATGNWQLASSQKQEASIEIYNVLGEKIYTELVSTSPNSLPLGGQPARQSHSGGGWAFNLNFPNGIYILKISGEGEFILRKIIKAD